MTVYVNCQVVSALLGAMLATDPVPTVARGIPERNWGKFKVPT